MTSKTSDNSTVFLPPLSTSPSPASSPETSHNLPVKLSTLLPVPPQDLGLENCDRELGNNKKRVPIIPWHGIEAVVESYKNFLKDYKDEKSVLSHRIAELKSEMVVKRSKVDELSHLMSGLVRNQGSLTAQGQSLEGQIRVYRGVLGSCNGLGGVNML